MCSQEYTQTAAHNAGHRPKVPAHVNRHCRSAVTASSADVHLRVFTTYFEVQVDLPVIPSKRYPGHDDAESPTNSLELTHWYSNFQPERPATSDTAHTWSRLQCRPRPSLTRGPSRAGLAAHRRNGNARCSCGRLRSASPVRRDEAHGFPIPGQRRMGLGG